MILVFAAAAAVLALAACVVTLARRGSARGDLRAEAVHQRAFHDASTVHDAAAMGDGYHR